MTSHDHFEFFFDVGSPYSYLAATQVERVAERADVWVRWRPFLLGGVFKATSNHQPASVVAKARWMVGDLRRWAARYGVPFKMSRHFPLNTLRAQRALVAVERDHSATQMTAFAGALFEAYWVSDTDISDPAVVGGIASAVGLDGTAVVAAAGEQEVKDLLRQTTEEAIERGAFGAPTFFVGDEMFWGNDRLQLVEEALDKG